MFYTKFPIFTLFFDFFNYFGFVVYFKKNNGYIMKEYKKMYKKSGWEVKKINFLKKKIPS